MSNHGLYNVVDMIKNKIISSVQMQESDAPITPTTPNPKSGKKEKEKAADEDDDGHWTVDVSEAAVRARMQGKLLHNLTEHANRLLYE